MTVPFERATLATRLPRRYRVAQVAASTRSTNADALAAARTGTADGAVFVALHQSAGRGRFARRWEAPPGSSVAISVLLRPDRPVARWGWLSLLAGLAVGEGIQAVSGLDARVKWPNDVLLDGRKVCGILAERADDGVVIGMGVNLTLEEEELPVPTATSLRLAGAEVPALDVTASILTALDGWLRRWERGEDLRPAYEAGCDTIGRHVRVVESEDSAVDGLAVGIDAHGRLVVDVVGDRRSFAAGDVWHLR